MFASISVLIKQISKIWKFSKTTCYNSSSNWWESKGTTNEISYPRIIKALDRILYLIGNQGIFLSWNTENSCKQWHLVKSRKFFSDCLASYTLLSFTIWAHIFTTTKRHLLYESSKSKWIDCYCCEIHCPKMAISADESASVYVYVYIRQALIWFFKARTDCPV